TIALTSRPSRLAFATSPAASFDSRLSVSTIGISRRRSASRPASSASSLDGSRPRERRRVSTAGRSSRSRAGSSMALNAIPGRLAVRYDAGTMVTPKARVLKAVFPAAGLGTRFLPATKAQPKEMLPLVDKPIIQYGIEEAVDAGVENIVIV